MVGDGTVVVGEMVVLVVDATVVVVLVVVVVDALTTEVPKVFNCLMVNAARALYPLTLRCTPSLMY